MKQATKRQPNAGSWKPGQSGNPAGRPRTGLAFAERIRERVDPDVAIDLLLAFASDATVSAERRLGALLPWMQAGYLRPPTQLDAHVTGSASTPDVDWSKVPLDERRALLEHHRRVRELAATGRQPSGATDDEQLTDGAPCHERAAEGEP